MQEEHRSTPGHADDAGWLDGGLLDELRWNEVGEVWRMTRSARSRLAGWADAKEQNWQGLHFELVFLVPSKL